MESSIQAYWHSEYQEFKNWIVSTKANNIYRSFAKRQYHKARRRHDKQIIDNQLDEFAKEEQLLNEIFSTNRTIFN